MESREVVIVEGLSWTKADKKAQMSKVRTHARIVGLRTLELRRKSVPALKCGRKRRKQSTTETPCQDRSLRPLAPASEMPPYDSKSTPEKNSSSATMSSSTRKSSHGAENTPSELDANSRFKRWTNPVRTRLDPDPYLRGYRKGRPFEPVPPNACQNALDFYIRYYVPNNAAMYEIFNVANISNTFFLELLQHPVFFPAGLANVLHELEFFLSPGGNPSQRLYMHVGMALAKLRRELDVRESPLDDVSIAAVMNLAVVARQLEDQEAHKLHREQLRLMVQARGGLDALDSDGPTIFAGERPNSDANKHPSHAFPENTRKLLSQLPARFQNLARQDKLTLPTIKVLVRTAKAAKDKKNNTPVIRYDEVFAYKKRHYHDLMQACPALADPTEAPTLEKLVVMALILFCSATFCEVRLPTRHTTVTVVGATSGLSKLKIPTTRAELKALIWVYMVVLDAWRSRERHMRSPGVNLLRLFKGKFPDMKDWEDVVEELQDFFCDQDVESFMSEAWGDV